MHVECVHIIFPNTTLSSHANGCSQPVDQHLKNECERFHPRHFSTRVSASARLRPTRPDGERELPSISAQTRGLDSGGVEAVKGGPRGGSLLE
ncbi:hypothetical protein AOLI_G00322540 [Acnodon oligacanthus]